MQLEEQPQDLSPEHHATNQMVKYLEASFRDRVEERVCKANRQWNLLVDHYADLGPSGLSPKTKQYALYAA